jgi:hypothetical protein
MRLTLALACAGLALAAAEPALALSGECFWSHLEGPTRRALLDGYQRQGPEVMDRVFIADRELQAIDAQCEAASVDDAVKERLLAATVFEHGSAVFLKGWLRWGDGELQQAWSRLRPEQAGQLRRQAEAAVSGAPPSNEELFGPIGAFLGRDPGREDPALVDQVRGYLTSRAIREATERRR